MFEWAVKHNVSEKQFNGVRKIIQEEFEAEIDSMRAMRRNLSSELGLYEKVYHCCIDNCMAFTPPFEDTELCRHCKKPQYYKAATPNGADLELKPRAVYRYLPLIPRLKLLYANKDYSKRMRYPNNLCASPWEEGDGVRDIWEGEEVRALINRGMKGFQMRLRADAKDFSRTSALWPFIFPQTVFNSFVMAIKMCGPFSLST